MSYLLGKPARASSPLRKVDPLDLPPLSPHPWPAWVLILVLAAFVGQLWALVMIAYDGNTLREKASYRAEGSGGILYTIRGGIPSFTHENRRGDVNAKTSSTGILTYQAQYQAFGKRTQEQGATLDRQKGCSKDEDPTGLRDEGRRITDLETGSFITEDPAGMIDGPNLYTYVMDNPWTHFDPEGLATEADYQNRIDNDKQVIAHRDATQGGVNPKRDYSLTQDINKNRDSINKIEKTARDLEKATRMAVGSVDGSKLNDSDQTYKEFATTQRLLDFWPGSGIADHAAHGEYAAAAKEFGVNVAESLAVGKLLGLAGKVLSKFAPDITIPEPSVPPTTPRAGPLPPGEDPYQLQLFPDKTYQRTADYVSTPTKQQRASVPQGMEFDHDPTLVQHYYEGPGDGSLEGFNLTQTEREAYAASNESGQAATPAQQRAQGGFAAQYSKQQKKLWGF